VPVVSIQSREGKVMNEQEIMALRRVESAITAECRLVEKEVQALENLHTALNAVYESGGTGQAGIDAMLPPALFYLSTMVESRQHRVSQIQIQLKQIADVLSPPAILIPRLQTRQHEA
jgi:hypothetical protein